MSKSKKFYQESSVEGVHSADYPWKPGVSVAGRYTREAGSARDIGKEDEARRNEALARKIHQSNLKDIRGMEKPNLTKSNLPDWTEWILEKNAAAEKEQLNKSDFVEIEVLEKAATHVLAAPGAPPDSGDSGDGNKPIKKPIKGEGWPKGWARHNLDAPLSHEERAQAEAHHEKEYQSNMRAWERLQPKDKHKLQKGAAPKIDVGHSVFTMDHVNQVAVMKDHAAAKELAHGVVDSSSANPKNKMKIKAMIDSSKNPAHLAQGMSNHILAHPGEGLRVIKGE